MIGISPKKYFFSLYSKEIGFTHILNIFFPKTLYSTTTSSLFCFAIKDVILLLRSGSLFGKEKVISFLRSFITLICLNIKDSIFCLFVFFYRF